MGGVCRKGWVRGISLIFPLFLSIYSVRSVITPLERNCRCNSWKSHNMLLTLGSDPQTNSPGLFCLWHNSRVTLDGGTLRWCFAKSRSSQSYYLSHTNVYSISVCVQRGLFNPIAPIYVLTLVVPEKGGRCFVYSWFLKLWRWNLSFFAFIGVAEWIIIWA